MKRYAIFFPQYYQINVNDRAWGYGFTDWSLVAAANTFNYWPRRSPACGFYDLSRDDHIRSRFDCASEAGLDGFAIYHYRFDDGPELQAVEQYLRRMAAPEGFKYFYIWANENWSTRWVGGKIRLLKELSRSPDRRAVTQHVDYLARFMTSASYTRVDDRPLFVFYRPDHFSETDVTLALYREEFGRAGLNPLLGFFVKNVNDLKYSELFDFCYLFEPRLFFNFQGVRKNPGAVLAYRTLARMFSPRALESISEFVTSLLNKYSATYSFGEFLQYFSSEARRKFIHSFQCPFQDVLTCGWNNAPRYRKRFTRLDTPSVEQFSSMMNIVSGFSAFRSEVPLLCNAWNEWAEGAAIEPCCYLGDAFLKSYLMKEGIVERECEIRL